MKKTYLLISFALIIASGLKAQEPVTPDTLVKKNVTVSTDTTVLAEQVPMKQTGKNTSTKTRKDTRPLKDRIDFDISTSIWANKSQVFGEFSILVSYRFPKILSIGTGPTYIYNYQRGPAMNLNGWGGKVFVKARLAKFLYLWTEYQGIDNQYISGNDPVTGKPVRSHAFVDSWYLGAGLNLRFGRRAGINLSVLYDVLHDPGYSPYNSAVVYRVGFGF